MFFEAKNSPPRPQRPRVVRVEERPFARGRGRANRRRREGRRARRHARRGELRAAMVAFAARGDARGARAVWLLHELERDLVRKWGLVDGDRTATLSAVAAELLRRLVIVI